MRSRRVGISIRLARWSWILGLFPSILPAQSYRTHVYNELSGLPSSHVADIDQDREGRIWIATRNGLAVYDGRDWSVHRDFQGITNSSITSMAIDERDRVWAMTLETPVHILEGDAGGITRKPISTPRDMRTNWHSQLEVIYREGNPELLVKGNAAGLYHWSQGRWSVLQREDGLAGDLVRGMTHHDGAVYISTSSGLSVFGEKGIDNSLTEHLPPRYRDLCAVHPETMPSGQIRIWILGVGWLGYLEDGRFTFIREHDLFPYDELFHRTRVMPDGAGGLFYGHELQLWHLPPDLSEPVQMTTETGMISNGHSEMMRDWEGNFWFASFRGVTKVPSLRFQSMDAESGLAENEVTAVLETSPGVFLFAHNRSITRYDGQTVQHRILPEPYRENSMVRIMDLSRGVDGTIWAAIHLVGVASFEEDLRLRLYPIETPTYTVLADSSGEVWAGGIAGLSRLEGDTFEEIDLGRRIGIRRIQQAASGTLYAATFNTGILRREKAWNSIPREDETASFYAVMEDREGRLFAGAADGLYHLERGTLRKLTAPGLGNDRPVYFLLQDRGDRIWMGHDDGVSWWDGHRSAHYSARHGLAGLETNRAAGLLSTAGDVWIGTDLGVSRYRAAYDRLPALPRILLTEVRVGNRLISSPETLELAHDQNDLSFGIRALSFVNEQHNRFSYRLEGHDSDWNEQANPGVRYVDLPPGEYRLHLRARNALGTMGREITSQPIVIARPYWRTWWFTTLISISAIAFIFGVGVFLSTRRASRRLEAEVANRTAHIQSLLEDLETLNHELEDRVADRTAELEEARDELVEKAHFAGMAEIANSILHNVGNVLNSITTSGFLLRDALERSKLSAFVRANSLLEDRRTLLSETLHNDSRGRQLLDFYPSLATKLTAEQGAMREQVDGLLHKIDTIREVIAQHHNYASGVYQNETLDLGALIGIALEVMGPSLEKNAIEILEKREPVPRVVVQKTKMIHVLVNLIKNAKEAITESNQQEGRIEIVLKREGSHLNLSMRDNGGGIPPENLTRIFSHGFTTKLEGNGFGLHSCATSMQEMGGSIRAESPGTGQGAIFVLELPIPAPERVHVQSS